MFLDKTKVIYEYAVSFDPQIDARNMRFKMLSNLQEHIGYTKSFDGAKLWLPQKLRDKVSFFFLYKYKDMFYWMNDKTYIYNII